MEHGIDRSDPFGMGALFVSQSMAHRFNCIADVDLLFGALLALEVPQAPNETLDEVLVPIDELLLRIKPNPALIELVRALVELGTTTPPSTPVAERLYRAVLWVMMRHDPHKTTPEVLRALREATPGGLPATSWPSHEFFAIVVLLVYMGGPTARRELMELLGAARDLDYLALALVLEWYLDHDHSAPTS